MFLGGLDFSLNKAILISKAPHCCYLSLTKATNFSQIKPFDNSLPINLITQLKHISNNSFVVIATFNTDILHCHQLDCYGCLNGSFKFYSTYWTSVSQGKLPKFGISNKMLQIYCQDYLGLLNGFTSAEKAVIAKTHSVITILKLRPNNKFNSGLYRGVQGHSILLPQNPGRLLNLLLSNTTSVNDVMQVVWVGKMSSQPKQLKRFVNIWKYHIISALNWLGANNSLYKNIKINQHLLNIWEDKFIPSGIIDNMVHCNPNHYKRMCYAVDLCDSNYENDFDITIENTSIERDNINSGCVYSNINNLRENLTLQFLFAIGNMKATAFALNITTTIISYCNKSPLIPLNDWEDPYYFTAAFFYLFLFENRGH